MLLDLGRPNTIISACTPHVGHGFGRGDGGRCGRGDEGRGGRGEGGRGGRGGGHGPEDDFRGGFGEELRGDRGDGRGGWEVYGNDRPHDGGNRE